MTDQTTHSPVDPQGSSSERSLALLIVAAALVITVVVLVLIFGVAHPPEVMALEDQPDPAPSASVAWNDDEHDEPCVAIAAPDGTTTELRCTVDRDEVVAWDADGIVVRTWRAREELLWLDPETGEEERRDEVDDPAAFETYRHSEITSRTRSGTLQVTLDATGELIWETDAPDGYRVQTGSVSPDGAWVALIDSADRLLVVPADGSQPPRLWAEDVSSWQAPVWEGTSLREAG